MANQNKVFCGGLSWSTDDARLRAYFENYGEVQECFVSYDRTTGRPRGFGFVVFQSPDVAERVCNTKHTVDRREVECKRAVPKEEHPGPAAQSTSSAAQKTRKIFVGGLAPSVDEQVLRQFFEAFGPVEDAVVMYDHDNKRPRGFGFITFAEEESVDKVFAHGAMQSIHDKQIEIKPAVPRDQMPPVRRGPPFFPQQQQQQQQPQQQSGRGGGMPFAGMGGRGPGNLPYGPQATQQHYRQQQPHQQAAAAAAAAYQQQAAMAQQYGIAPLQQQYLPQQLPQQQQQQRGYGASQRLQQRQQQFGGVQQPQLNLGTPYHRGSSPQQGRPGSASTPPFVPQQQPYGQQPQAGGAAGFGVTGGSVAGRLHAAGYAGAAAAAAAMYSSLGGAAGFPNLPGADLSGAGAGAAPSAAMYAAAAAQAQAQAQQQLNSLQQQMNGFPGAADMAAVTSKLGALSTHDVQGPGTSTGARTSSGGGYSLSNPSAGLGAGASHFAPFPAGQQTGASAFAPQQQQQPQAEVSSGFGGGDPSNAANVFGTDATGASSLSATPDFSAFDGSSFSGAPPPGWSS